MFLPMNLPLVLGLVLVNAAQNIHCVFLFLKGFGSLQRSLITTHLHLGIYAVTFDPGNSFLSQSLRRRLLMSFWKDHPTSGKVRPDVHRSGEIIFRDSDGRKTPLSSSIITANAGAKVKSIRFKFYST